MGKRKKISVVSTLHYIRLVYRSALFVLLLISYIRFRIFNEAPVIERVEGMPVIIYVTWAVFVIEMILRFFPSEYESPGCQKQFAGNYIKSGSTEIDISDNNSTVLIALIWIVFNGIFGALNMAGVANLKEQHDEDGLRELSLGTGQKTDAEGSDGGHRHQKMLVEHVALGNTFPCFAQRFVTNQKVWNQIYQQ